MPAHILVAEDDELLRKLLVTVLGRASYKVQDTATGTDTLRILESTKVNLLILDLVMSEKEGFGTLLEIRHRWPACRILAILGGGRLGSQEYLRLASGLGAHRVLAKPFGTEQFLKSVFAALHASSSERGVRGAERNAERNGELRVEPMESPKRIGSPE